jgi:hypothetical protein|tara:strand:+ start:937 stop:1548 length:612 start_codon:yes stop_codon:yes gene_type:complete
MASTTIDLDTELSAVNSILGAIGQAPLTTLNFDNPEVAFIFNLLRDANVDTQSEGWHFNTEKHVKFAIDANGRIAIGNDIVSMDLHDNYNKRTMDLVRRNGFLYDKIDHTDVFTSDLDLDIVRLYNFEDLPSPFRRYITYRASRQAATQLVANPNLAQLLQGQESLARAALMEYECNQADHSMLGFEDNTTYQTYQPFKNLRR